jgi:ABC-type sugar transport system substrate-binding protein
MQLFTLIYEHSGRHPMELFRAIASSGLSLLLLASSPGCSRKPDAHAKKRIAGIVFQEDQFFRQVLLGMRTAARRNNVELLEANSAGQPDKEVALVNTYIAANVDAIVVSPLSVRASMAALARAKEKGIAIVTYNTTVDGDLPSCFVQSDQRDLGRVTGRAVREYIEKTLNGKARVAILAFQSQLPEMSSQRVEGFKEQLAGLPGVSIVAEQDAWLPEQAVRKAGDMITAHPNLDLIWSANEGGTVGSVMAVKNAGKAGRIVVFGTDTGEQIADFLLADDNILQSVAGQDPFRIGGLAVESALKIIRGEPVQNHIALPAVPLSRNDTTAILEFKAHLKALTR